MAETSEPIEQRISTVYSPSAIANIFNNVLNSNLTKTVMLVKGIYVKGRGMNYGGYYYDQLKEENSDASITLIVPAIIRANLVPNQVIELSAFLTKKVEANGSKIVLQLNLMDLFAQRESEVTEEQLKRIKLIQKKAKMGYRDVDSFIKSKIVGDEKTKVIIIIGNNAIIDNDIKHQLEEAIGFYKFRFERISLASEASIISALQALDEETDILVIARGGGDNMSIFDKPGIAEVALGLKSYFLTAIGHEIDKTLLQQVADKAFITPSHLGQYLNTVYNETISELQNSKAKLVEDITKQLQTNYEHQISTLKQQAIKSDEINAQRGKELKYLYEEKIRVAKNAGWNNPIFWILVVAAAIIAFFVGRGFH